MPGFVRHVRPWLMKSDLFFYHQITKVCRPLFSSPYPIIARLYPQVFYGVKSLLGDAAKCHVVPIGDSDALTARMFDSLEQASNITELYRLSEPYKIHS